MANAYWQNIREAVQTLSTGLRLTLRHFGAAGKNPRVNAITREDYFDKQVGIATVQYPHESLPVPDNGRYRLHNEIDDCIVCDKCAKICPVDCIDIEAVRSPEVFGTASDGTARRIYAAKFDIDIGKCCFCGLCTTVCPTECLTMTKTFDFSEYDIDDHIYEFATMTPLEILEKKKAWEEHLNGKSEEAPVQSRASVGKPKIGGKPRMGGKPGLAQKPVIRKKEAGDDKAENKSAGENIPEAQKPAGHPTSKKPVIRPKPVIPGKRPKKDE